MIAQVVTLQCMLLDKCFGKCCVNVLVYFQPLESICKQNIKRLIMAIEQVVNNIKLDHTEGKVDIRNQDVEAPEEIVIE